MLRIYLDDHYAFSIPQEAYSTSHLYEKEELTEAEVEDIKDSLLVRTAREQAVRFLSFKDRSEHELLSQLISKGFDKAVAHHAISELKSIGYVDDKRFAHKFVSDKTKQKAISQKALKFELEQKGVTAAVVEEVLSDFELDEEEIALRMAKKKFGKYKLSDPQMERKVIQFLMHKGFTYELSASVYTALNR